MGTFDRLAGRGGRLTAVLALAAAALGAGPAASQPDAPEPLRPLGFAGPDRSAAPSSTAGNGGSAGTAATSANGPVPAPAGTTSQDVGPSDFLPVPDRYRIGLPADYVQNARSGGVADPYGQNVLKGDYPIFGQDQFLVLTATSDSLFEARRVEVPSGVSTLHAGSFKFFGSGDQQAINQNLILSADFFQGDAGYKPRDWEVRATVVGNVNYVHANELALLRADVRGGQDRTDGVFAVQELFAEKRLVDVAPSFDFASVRVGVQGFTSDFRGFLFSDDEPGVRLFGNADDNKVQYNLAWFNPVEKDTNSGLNTPNFRQQDVFVANAYRQDFAFPGYTAQGSFQANLDNGDVHYDRNGFLVRPAPIGTISQKDVHAFYIGWAGDGHIGKLNVTHQFYEALGTESFNPLAGRKVDINAQFAALELSYDFDFVRLRASAAYASGDGNPTDGHAGGFDSIFDNPNFAGGGFSYFTRQALRLTGSGVDLVNRNSFLPDLRTSKEQGQADFVNPGLRLFNVGADFNVTPKLTVNTNASYLQFDDPSSLRLLLNDNKINRQIGFDLSVGAQYRPLLSNNVILTGGAAALVPQSGFREIYNSRVLYSTFVAATVTY